MDGARGVSTWVAWLRLVKSRWRFGSNLSLSARLIDAEERGDAVPFGEELRLQGRMKDPVRHRGEADWLTGSTPTLCAVHSSSSRDSLHPPLSLSGGGVGVSQRKIRPLSYQRPTKGQASAHLGERFDILHGIPCIASCHSHPLAPSAFVRSVPFRSVTAVGTLYCIGAQN